jgi:hypothetical protein
VELLMDVPQALVGDVGVDLGGRHVLVAQKLLDEAAAGTPILMRISAGAAMPRARRFVTN